MHSIKIPFSITCISIYFHFNWNSFIWIAFFGWPNDDASIKLYAKYKILDSTKTSIVQFRHIASSSSSYSTSFAVCVCVCGYIPYCKNCRKRFRSLTYIVLVTRDDDILDHPYTHFVNFLNFTYRVFQSTKKCSSAQVRFKAYYTRNSVIKVFQSSLRQKQISF